MSTTTRARILAAVRTSQPMQTPLPEVPAFGGDASREKFAAALAGIGGRVIGLGLLAHLAEAVRQHYPANYLVASNLIPTSVPVTATMTIAELAPIDLAVLRGEFGVAENGAVWLPEANMLHRALPTIAQHLVLVLDQQALVATMHQAYACLPGVGGYGVFLAGPSKTADIEQSLVIGAHGSRSLTVFLYGESA